MNVVDDDADNRRRLVSPKHRRCREALGDRGRCDTILKQKADQNAGVLDRMLKLGTVSLAVGIENLDRLGRLGIQANRDMKAVLGRFCAPRQFASDGRSAGRGADTDSHSHTPSMSSSINPGSVMVALRSGCSPEISSRPARFNCWTVPSEWRFDYLNVTVA